MKNKTNKILLWMLDLGINIAIIFGLVLIIQQWLIAPFDVSGASMCNTLNFLEEGCVNGYGEKIIINEATYLFNDPERGDVIVFKANTEEDKYFIKRVIGLPGEIIELKDGEVYVTKKGSKESIKLNEDYLNAENKGETKPYFSDFKVFEVPENQYFALGDNRKSSTDSRSCFQSTISETCRDNPEKAFISEDLIRGKAWIVWWPLSSIRTIHPPSYNYTPTPKDQTDSVSLEEK